jgi:hypothetical protein
MVVGKLREKGINARGDLRRGEVAPSITKAAVELKANILFIGTTNLHPRPRFYMARDPIVHYLVDNCPVSLCLVRGDDPSGQPGILANVPAEE